MQLDCCIRTLLYGHDNRYCFSFVCIYGHINKDIFCLNEHQENKTRLSREGADGLSFVITQSVFTLEGTSAENNRRRTRNKSTFWYSNFSVKIKVNSRRFGVTLTPFSDFELFLISNFLSLRKIRLTDFYFTLHEC